MTDRLYVTLQTLLNARGYDKGMYFTHEQCTAINALWTGYKTRVERAESDYKLLERSVVEMGVSLDKMLARAERAERMVERLIEAGKKLSIIALLNTREDKETWERWQALVAEWRAR